MVSLVNGQVEPGGMDRDEAAPVPGLALEVLSTQVPDGADAMYLVAAQFGSQVSPLTAQSRLAGRVPIGIRQADLQEVDTQVHYRQACADLCTTRAVELRYQDHPTYAWIKFPLQQHETWSGPLLGGTPDDDLLGNLLVHSRVVGMEHVATPMGPVDAVRIEHTMDAPNLAANLERLRSEGHERGYTGIVAEASLAFTRTVHFGPAQLAIVRDASTLHLHEHTAWVDGTDTHDVQLDVDVETLQVLADVAFEEVGDLDLKATLEAISPGSSIKAPPLATPEPPPAPVGDSTQELRVWTDATDLNAALRPTIALHVDTSRPLPAGHELQLVVAGPRGNQVIPQQQGTYLLGIQEMGTYIAVAQEVADGAVVARDTLVLPVWYEQQTDLDCPLIDITPTACPALNVPVRTGIGRLTIDATRKSAPLPARLQLTDADGQLTTADFPGDSAHIILTEFPGHAATGEDWTLEYKPTVAAGDHVTVNVLLEPAAANTSPTPGAMGGLGEALAFVAAHGWE